MALPAVAQAPLIAAEMRRAAEQSRATSVAILGCAGGNGCLDLAAVGVSCVVAVDINPKYVARTRERHAHRFAHFDGIVADCSRDTIVCRPVDLVFAGLIFEFVPVASLCEQASRLLRPGGVFSTMIQLPSAIAEVTPSPYATSLEAVGSAMSLVTPSDLESAASAVRLSSLSERVVSVPGGKSFSVRAFVWG